VRRTVISIDSEKTGMRIERPLLPQLKETLDAGPTGDLAFIVTGAARPGIRLRTEFGAAARAAGCSENPPMGSATARRRGPRTTARPSAS
jgi:hypothetical protein